MTERYRQTSFWELSQSQVKEFYRRGFIDPINVWDEDEMDAFKRYAFKNIISHPHPHLDVPSEYYRHVDDGVVRDVVTKDRLVGMISDLLQSPAMIWSTKFWNKTPGQAEIPWHQHYHHMPVQPQISFTAWIAITEMTPENGCLELIPGSHKTAYPEVESPEGKSFEHMTDPDCVDESRSVRMEMDPGDVILFTEKTLHKSSVNTSDVPRLSLSIRAAPPYVDVDEEKVGDGEYPTVLPVSGQDWVGVNETIEG